MRLNQVPGFGCWSPLKKPRPTAEDFGRDADTAVDDVDPYRRPVGRVRVGREDVNAAMVRQGGAWVFTRYNRDPALVAV